MVKHNWCAKIGAKYIRFHKYFGYFYQKHIQIAYYGGIICSLEAVIIFYCVISSLLTNTLSYLKEEIIGINLFVLALVLFGMVCSVSYKHSRRIIRKLKINAHDEYLQEEFNRKRK